METLGYARSFRDLVVYQKARSVAKEVFGVTKAFPTQEMHALTGQIRRSSRSVGAQIAEVWGKRRYVRHFEAKLSDADAEQLETQHWLETALDCGYLDAVRTAKLSENLAEIGRMLNSMMEHSQAFCGRQESRAREPDPVYCVHADPPTSDH